MAGMLPGVGVPQRRKINQQIRQDSFCSRYLSPLTVTEPLDRCITDLDENALRARQRLQQKLGYLHPSSRSGSGSGSGSGELPQNKCSGRNCHIAVAKNTLLGTKFLGSQWHLKLRRRCKSYPKKFVIFA